MSLRSLFVTRVYEFSLSQDKGFDALFDDLEQACYSLANEDEAGQAWCAVKFYPGYTSYASLDDLPRRMSVFGDLKRILDKHVSGFARDLHLDLGGRRLVLDNLWVNILEPGGGHTGHIHPHSVVSGTVYICVPPNASALKLEDPRLSRMMAAPPRHEGAPETDRSFVYLQPERGTLFLWESWLRHEVTPNLAQSERISISFNYAWK